MALLGGVGYLLAQTTSPTRPYPTKPISNPVVRKAIERQEAFSNPEAPGVSTRLKGTNPELDLRYDSLMGTPLTAAPAAPGYIPITTPPLVKPRSGDTATPDVMMNPAGIEGNPTYVDGDVTTSILSGQAMKTSDFVHNNMQPFFGSRVRQNVGDNTNVSRLDMYTGAGSTQVRKQEVEQMFDNTQVPFGNVYGMESSTDFVQSRVNDPRNRAGERPFEPVRVAPGVGEGFSSTGKGGFQQFEVNQVMIDNIKRTDDLRVANNPKTSYNLPVVEGQQFIGKAMDSPGEVRKYRPDGFFIDEDGKHFGPAGQGEFTKEAVRPIQVMPHWFNAGAQAGGGANV